MSLLAISQLSYAYQNRKDHYILDQVNQEFAAGKFYAILGTSGSGKTTLLSLLAGLDSPLSGVIEVNGEDIIKKGYNIHRKENVSIVFQNYNLLDYMTPLENIQLINPKGDKELLLAVGLSENEIQRNVLQLSGGQQQRVAIARALSSDSPIILADEPTGNLDETTAEDIVNILKASAHEKNKCVIVVTHSQALAKEADVILKLEHKQLLTVKA